MVRPKVYGSVASTSAERQSLLRSKEDRKRVDGYLSQEAYGVLKQYADTNGLNLSTALESIIWETQGGVKEESSPVSFAANASDSALNSLNCYVASPAVASSVEKPQDVSSFFERRKREILKGE